jgi:adenine-specific DNA-methyltransferase
MEKLKMKSIKITETKLNELRKKFPNIVVEKKGADGLTELGLDLDEMKREFSDLIVDDKKERYQLTWPDKKKAIAVANVPINKTLRANKEESVNFDNTKNLYIEGDNLDVLKLIRETYLNSIKLIYIDPPYNAGADILYKNNYEMDEDDFKKANYDIDEEGYVTNVNSDTNGRFHTDWINMIYSRIKVARDLLSPDGCIVIAIDHNELVNLVKVCDEIFNETNRVGIITIVHKPEGRNQERYFASSNEFALFYAKDKTKFDLEPAILDTDLLKEYNLSDSKGKYKLISAIAKNHGRDGYDKNLRVNNPKNFYPIYVSPDCSDITLDEKKGYLVALPITDSQERTWRYIVPSFKEKLNQDEFVAQIENGKARIFEKYRIEKGQLIKTHWLDKKYNAMVYGTKLLDDLMKMKTFDFPKSLYLMEDILKITTKKDSVILDFFSGSSTTAHAVMDLNSKDNGNRKFIMVQLPYPCDEKSEAYKNGFKTIPEIAKERIRLAGKKIQQEYASFSDTLDIGFRVLKLDSSNMKDVFYNPSNLNQNLIESTIDNVKEDRNPLDLLFQVMLDLGIELSAKIEEREINRKKYFIVNESYLVACFDTQVDENTIKEIAKIKPVYAVFRDASFKNDSSNINCEQIIKSISNSTELRVL